MLVGSMGSGTIVVVLHRSDVNALKLTLKCLSIVYDVILLRSVIVVRVHTVVVVAADTIDDITTMLRVIFP